MLNCYKFTDQTYVKEFSIRKHDSVGFLEVPKKSKVITVLEADGKFKFDSIFKDIGSLDRKYSLNPS